MLGSGWHGKVVVLAGLYKEHKLTSPEVKYDLNQSRHSGSEPASKEGRVHFQLGKKAWCGGPALELDLDRNLSLGTPKRKIACTVCACVAVCTAD